MRVVIAADRSQDRDQYRSAALGAGLECQANDCVTTVDLTSRLAREPAADLVLVGLSGPTEQAIAAIENAASVARTVALAVGPVTEAALIRRASSAGARRYLDEDQLTDQLGSAVESLGREGAITLRRGRVLAVTSALPGSGATTVARGLAFALTANKAGTVVLSEPGTGVPELALDLNVKPTHGLEELLPLSERADSGMIRAASVPHPSGVAVIAYSPETLAAQPVSAGQARRLLPVLRAAYDWVVLDLGHGLSEGNEAFLTQADRILVVTRQDVPALRITRRYLKTLPVSGQSDRVVLLANRYGQPGHLPWKKVEETLNRTVREWIPDDASGINSALTAGEPPARRSAVQKTLTKLARSLVVECKASGR